MAYQRASDHFSEARVETHHSITVCRLALGVRGQDEVGQPLALQQDSEAELGEPASAEPEALALKL